MAGPVGSLLLAGVLLYLAAPNRIASSQQLPLTAVSQTEAPPLIEKNVEDIRAGDLVVSYDEATGRQVFNRVVETYERTSYHLRFIETRSLETGEVQTFETTDEHPFWQVDIGWIDAGKLQAGDQLLQSNGQFAEVVSTRYEAHPEGVTVYNFQVADAHSYYVSAPTTRGPPVLVHNANYGLRGGLYNKPLKPGEFGSFGDFVAGAKKVPSPEAKSIANGHAWDKHVVTQNEFPEIATKEQFEHLVDDVMASTVNKNLAGGRKAWWNDAERTVVIRDPKNPDGGTAFRPWNGKAYFDNLK